MKKIILFIFLLLFFPLFVLSNEVEITWQANDLDLNNYDGFLFFYYDDENILPPEVANRNSCNQNPNCEFVEIVDTNEYSYSIKLSNLEKETYYYYIFPSSKSNDFLFSHRSLDVFKENHFFLPPINLPAKLYWELPDNPIQERVLGFFIFLSEDMHYEPSIYTDLITCNMDSNCLFINRDDFSNKRFLYQIEGPAVSEYYINIYPLLRNTPLLGRYMLYKGIPLEIDTSQSNEEIINQNMEEELLNIEIGFLYEQLSKKQFEINEYFRRFRYVPSSLSNERQIIVNQLMELGLTNAEIHDKEGISATYDVIWGYKAERYKYGYSNKYIKISAVFEELSNIQLRINNHEYEFVAKRNYLYEILRNYNLNPTSKSGYKQSITFPELWSLRSMDFYYRGINKIYNHDNKPLDEFILTKLEVEHYDYSIEPKQELIHPFNIEDISFNIISFEGWVKEGSETTLKEGTTIHLEEETEIVAIADGIIYEVCDENQGMECGEKGNRIVLYHPELNFFSHYNLLSEINVDIERAQDAIREFKINQNVPRIISDYSQHQIDQEEIEDIVINQGENIGSADEEVNLDYTDISMTPRSNNPFFSWTIEELQDVNPPLREGVNPSSQTMGIPQDSTYVTSDYEFNFSRNFNNVLKVMEYPNCVNRQVGGRTCLCGNECENYLKLAEKYIDEFFDSDFDLLLFISLIMQESSCDFDEESSSSFGLMQIHAETWCKEMNWLPDNITECKEELRTNVSANIRSGFYVLYKQGDNPITFRGCNFTDESHNKKYGLQENVSVTYSDWEARLRLYNGRGCNPGYPAQDYFVHDIMHRFSRLKELYEEVDKLTDSYRRPICGTDAVAREGQDLTERVCRSRFYENEDCWGYQVYTTDLNQACPGSLYCCKVLDDLNLTAPLKFVQNAYQEYQNWNQGTMLRDHPEALPFLNKYWAASGYIPNNPVTEPWSAAFISYITEEELKDSLHANYIKQVYDNLIDDWNFYVPEDIESLSKGDIICLPSMGSNPTIEMIESGDHYYSHCDIVVEINSNSIKYIGGNLGGSVKKIPLSLNNNKLPSNYFAVLRREVLLLS